MEARPTVESGKLLEHLGEESSRRPWNIGVKNILAPVDFSDCSTEALRYAAAFARQCGTGLSVLHVVVPHIPVDPYGVTIPNYFETDPVHDAWKELERLGRAVAPPEVPVRIFVRSSQSWAANEIVQAAAELGSDLIIIPTHGYTGLKHVILGSTAEYVVRHAPCPVLVVRAINHQGQE